ncbi:MAG: cytidylate kinase [Alphaproteobacteria bacterium ADurb.Bin438]|nr:MAG: cytidylate kinase [Alphaproteobacteria bacterium ADurb.Bin438]
MKSNIKTLIENIKNGSSKGLDPKESVIITISNTPGSGGEEIIAGLAKKLELDVFDKEIIRNFAEHTGTDADMFRLITEDSHNTKDFWFHRIFGKKTIDNAVIRKYLTNVMYALARVGNCIIVGRGGHVPLSDIATLRIRVTGSKDKCVERIMNSKNLSFDDANNEYIRHVSSSGKFVWNVFNSRLNDPINFDIVINTDHVTDFNYCVEMIITIINHIKENKGI